MRVALGIALLTISPTVSWTRLEDWWRSIYWYQYRSDSGLMYDLKHGNGLPSPANNPLEIGMVWGHGWPQENVDLARVALYELLQRDKAGKLPVKYRHEIDEFALANLYSPVSGPAQYYLDDELTRRLSSGKLTAAEQATIFKNAVTMTLAAQPIVVQWDPPSVQVTLKTVLPRGLRWGFGVEVTYRSIRIDGKEVSWSKKPWPQPAYDSIAGGTSRTIQRRISYTTPGRHRIDLDVQVEIRDSPGPIIHRERHTLAAYFVEIKPPLMVKVIRFLRDPQHEAGHYAPMGWLHALVSRGSVPVRDLAFAELTRRDRLGELPPDDVDTLVDHLLAIQRDRTQEWNGVFGDYIENLRATQRLPDAKWQQYGHQQLGFYLRARSEVGQGEPLPVEIVRVARRGNSHVSPFPACQWWVNKFVLDGVAQFIKLTNWDRGTDEDVGQAPNSGAEESRRKNALLPSSELGRHRLRATLEYDPTWTERPPGMEIATEYDLGQVEFTIVPRADAAVKAVPDPD